MTLPDKQNEALARLVGWQSKTYHDTYCIERTVWSRGDVRGQPACPNMATPEGADELVEFCRKRDWFIIIRPCPAGYAVTVERRTPDGGWHAHIEANINTILTDSRPEAVCKAVHALYEGGYLTEKEPADGKET